MFMKRAGSLKVGYTVFTFPKDMFTYYMSDIVTKLPLPTKGTSKMTSSS